MLRSKLQGSSRMGVAIGTSGTSETKKARDEHSMSTFGSLTYCSSTQTTCSYDIAVGGGFEH